MNISNWLHKKKWDFLAGKEEGIKIDPELEHHPECVQVDQPKLIIDGEEKQLQTWSCHPDCEKAKAALSALKQDPDKFDWLAGGPEELE